MRYEISHRTTYAYDDVVSASYGQLHQMPSDVDGQRCLERWVVIDPVPDLSLIHISEPTRPY